jgi:hypothetical protein
VLTYLADHPAMIQLMTPERDGALVHVKLAPMDGHGQVETTGRVRELLASHLRADKLRVGDATEPVVAAGQREDVRSRIEGLVGRATPADVFEEALARTGAGDAALEEIRTLRDRALDSEDSPVEGVPREEIETIEPATLVSPRGEALEELLRQQLPTLAANDPEGIHYVAKHLGPWVDEAIAKSRARARCAALAGDESGECDDLAVELSELDDTQWRVPAGVDAPVLREVPRILTLTGQPAVGQAFAESVTESLRYSALVSLAALAVMLLLSRQIFALVPATWTLTVTAGTIALLGHPISVGTSMVGCIALGAGVDFAIHLGVRARRLGGKDAGQQAVDQLGAVVLISALQLALAFSVLTASEMPPLRHFGVGLAVGLVGAALGAVWLTPLLLRGRGRSE